MTQEITTLLKKEVYNALISDADFNIRFEIQVLRENDKGIFCSVYPKSSFLAITENWATEFVLFEIKHS
jgi:hypothetical protein